MSNFREKIVEGKEFIITCELVPGRGIKGRSVDDVLEFGKKVIQSKLPVHAISITDNPGGNPAMSPDILAEELKEEGMESLVHFSCAGLNRNSIESRISSLARKGLENILVVTGDYPQGGYGGSAKPVFDLDSVQAIRYIKEMNSGIEIPGKKKGVLEKLPQTSFFVVCGVSPFGKREDVLIPQFIKLEKKIEAGADLIIANLGYDVRKFAEILKYLRYRNLDTPVFGNCYVLSRPVARLMNKGGVPGCVVTDELVRQIEQEATSADKGKQARLDRAARLTAIFRGMGMRGVHLGGFGLKFEDYQYIITQSVELTANWRDYIADFRYGQKDEFYLFPEDPDLTFAKELMTPVEPPKVKLFSINLGISKLCHKAVFTDGTAGFHISRDLCNCLEKTGNIKQIFCKIEHQIKRLLFDCQSCGDCVLFNTGYLCPMSACAKNQRNGPCGGSLNGKCESDSNKPCFWTLVYKRLSSAGKLDSLREYIPPVNHSLAKTSSWTNFFLGRDHTGKG